MINSTFVMKFNVLIFLKYLIFSLMISSKPIRLKLYHIYLLQDIPKRRNIQNIEMTLAMKYDFHTNIIIFPYIKQFPFCIVICLKFSDLPLMIRLTMHETIIRNNINGWTTKNYNVLFLFLLLCLDSINKLKFLSPPPH